MKTYQLNKQQIVESTINEIWSFFSSPENLDKLTPSNMGFEILTPRPLPPMFKGQIIEYKVRPVLNIPMYWKTEITEVKDQEYFVDEQLKGPYKLWRHKHLFEKHENGVLMTDELEYALPLGPLGSIARTLYVKKRLTEIFDYRFKMVDKLFNQKSA